MRKVLSLSLGALAVLLLTVALLGCGGGKSAPTNTNLKSMPDGSSQDVADVLAELDALEPPEGVDPALFEQLKEELARQLNAGGGKIVSTPSDYAINDFMEVDPVTDPPTVTWSCDALIADGSLNGSVGIEDVTPIAMYYGMQWNDPGGAQYEPLAKLADYDRNYTVAIADITPLAMTYGQRTGGFIVEWAEDVNGNGEPDEEDADYAQAADVAYDGDERLDEPNENGFYVWEFQFGVDQLPDVEGVWVRVVPYDADDEPNRGTASDPPIWIELGEPPPTLNVTDILVQVTGTTNTDVESDWLDTDFYAAPLAGGDTLSEAPANQHIVMDLADIAFQFDGLPYDFGTYPDDLPEGLTVEEFDAIMDTLYGFMNYTIESSEVPPDPEAWTEDATQPEHGYSGTLGPNDPAGDPGSHLLTATMADNPYTPGDASFTVTIDLNLTEDVNAPEISDFSPLEQRSNATEIHNLRMDWGEDQSGTEAPSLVALYDVADKSSPAYVFEPEDVPEVPDDPTEEGKYTYQHAVEFTFIRAKLTGTSLIVGHEYVWRVAEDDAGFQRRSSLKKPGDTLLITEAVYSDVNTWPEQEFMPGDSRQPYIYFVPVDPKIRRNPCGHPAGGEPPHFEPDDADAFADMIKGDNEGTLGQEFEVAYGSPGPPQTVDAPEVYYKMGSVPPQTIPDADGQLPVWYRQPHMIGGMAAVVPVEPGEVSFGLFSQSGEYKGGVTRTVVNMPITRMDVVINTETCDFGVRPWGDGTETVPVFDNKIADQSENDVVIFTFYNLWLRHDDSSSLPQEQQGTHLILTSGGADLPDLLLRMHILDSEDQGGLAYGALDVSSEDSWWQNISQPIATGTYTVTLYNPGAGTGMQYPDNLVIVP